MTIKQAVFATTFLMSLMGAAFVAAIWIVGPL